MADRVKTVGWAAHDSSGFLSPFQFTRRATGEEDVRLKVLYCGVCHSDLHNIKNEMGFTSYPCVPGHEVVGEVTEVGNKVKKFIIGDKVGVGLFVDSCGECEQCVNDVETYCPKLKMAYLSIDDDGTVIQGGYSKEMVIKERYVFRWPENLPLPAGTPLLGAGSTVYSPMKYYGLDKSGQHLGVVGLGGLGHLAVKFAKAFGLKVTVISTSPSKKDEAINHLGADAFLVSTDQEQTQKAMSTMDGIIDTVSAPHALMPLFSLLKPNGKLIVVGAPNKPVELDILFLVMGRKMLGTSAVGGVKETQEMIDFAAKHGIVADVEVVEMENVNNAMERLAKGDVRYRFVLDIGNATVAV
uniref:Protein REDOX 1 n=1 Tax=Catharanthus roseus TaxID=4058 RepID=REDX1_CATRO|nr:RecName: Full=Protein REDOX 1; AltName: Full=Cinnamyl alcohol dehydrogenase 4 [Catharanthus roseus]AVM85917.1 redox 1 [Catharanthus roseus]